MPLFYAILSVMGWAWLAIVLAYLGIAKLNEREVKGRERKGFDVIYPSDSSTHGKSL